MDNIIHKISMCIIRQQIHDSVVLLSERMDIMISDYIDVYKAYELSKSHNNDDLVHFNNINKSIQEIRDIHNGFMNQQQNYYSTVRIVEFDTESDKRFSLVYGDGDNSNFKIGDGTGPFISLEEATSWFTSGGR